jgi:ubiquinone/menaquinone biosynthesis C-methylase UbiE
LQGSQITATFGQYPLALPDGSQDFVVAPFVLQDYLDPTKAICEWYRVVKDGGFIIFTVPHSKRVLNKDEERNRFIELIESSGWRLLEVQDPDDLDENGFTVVIQVRKYPRI